MNSITIAIRNKTKLTKQLESLYDIKYYKKKSFFKKLTFQKHNSPDIYFHKGIFDSYAINLIKSSKVIVLNANHVRDDLLKRLPEIDQKKIYIMYPYILSTVQYNKELKKDFKIKHKIDKKSKIIFFRANDIDKGGIAFVLDMISQMYQENFTLIIESSSQQIHSLELQMNRTKLEYNYILFKDYKNKDELFIASDIFILPTSQRYFATDILKAMYHKNAIFLMQENYAIELLDIFSRIEELNDRSISFKVDSLLINKNDLKTIQKENQIKSQNYTFDKQFNRILKIIDINFDF